MTDASAQSPLDRLIGTWEFEASVEGRPMERGWATFEWIEGGAFVFQRAGADRGAGAPAEWLDHSPMPVSSVMGFDDATGELSMLYSDARGVRRIYRMRLADDAWTLWRDAPGFFQRFTGIFRAGGATLEGRWEASPDGSTWSVDFEIVYRRRDR